MVVVVFINDKDKSLSVLGTSLVKLLDRKYYVFTRMPSEFPFCSVVNTMSKLKEIAQHESQDRILISFGCRVLPNNIKEIEALTKQQSGSLVFLKRLRGSKTWREVNGSITFDNERIADCGIFVIDRLALLNTPHNNFNTFIRSQVQQKLLKAVFVDFWLFANQSLDKTGEH